MVLSLLLDSAHTLEVVGVLAVELLLLSAVPLDLFEVRVFNGVRPLDLRYCGGGRLVVDVLSQHRQVHPEQLGDGLGLLELQGSEAALDLLHSRLLERKATSGELGRQVRLRPPGRLTDSLQSRTDALVERRWRRARNGGLARHGRRPDCGV